MKYWQIREVRLAVTGLAIVAAAILSIFFIEFVIDRSDGYGVVCNLPSLVDDARIDISTPNFPELTIGLVYEVKAGSRIRIPATVFQNVTADESVSKKDFKLIRRPGSSLVGVVMSRQPNLVMIMHDFATNESWPFNKQLGPTLFGRLVRETGRDDLLVTRG